MNPIILFKYKNNFLQISEIFAILQEGNPLLDQIYRKAIKFIRDLELINFGLNMYIISKYLSIKIIVFLEAHHQKSLKKLSFQHLMQI